MSELKTYKMVDEKYCADCVCVIPSEVYLKSEVDNVIADLEESHKMEVEQLLMKIAELKADVNNVLIQNRELCQALQVMYSAEEYMELQDENTELKQKLENVQASMYCDVVDANMENRRLKRALWLARALRARDIQRWWIAATCAPKTERACSVWNNVERKCRAMADKWR